MKKHWLISVPPVPQMNIDGFGVVVHTDLDDALSVLETACNYGILDETELCAANAEIADEQTIEAFSRMSGGIVEL